MRPVQTAISPHAGLMPTPVFGAALRARMGAITGFGGLTGIGAGFGTGAVGGAGVGVCSPSPPFSPPPGLPCCSSGQLPVIFTGPAVADPPESTWLSSAVLVRVIIGGQFTVTVAVEVAWPSLVAAPVAVLLTVAQSAWVVDEVMWMVGSLATPRVPAKVQLRVCAPNEPVIV